MILIQRVNGDGTIILNSDTVNYTYSSEGVYTISLQVTNECGIDSASQQIVIVNSAIELNELIETVLLYPNPNNGNFDLEIKGLGLHAELNLTLWNILGNELDRRTIQFSSYAKEHYHFEELASGTYILLIQGNNGQVTLKVEILKQKYFWMPVFKY